MVPAFTCLTTAAETTSVACTLTEACSWEPLFAPPAWAFGDWLLGLTRELQSLVPEIITEGLARSATAIYNPRTVLPLGMIPLRWVNPTASPAYQVPDRRDGKAFPAEHIK